MSRYDYLDRELVPFLEKIGCDDAKFGKGLISSHGDKTYGYKRLWESAGIHYYHGCLVYLATHLRPYGTEVRNSAEHGFVQPGQWVADNAHRFAEHFVDVPQEDESDY